MLDRILNFFSANRSRNIEYEEPAKNLDCAEFEVDNWTISRFVLSKLVPVVGIQPFPLNELMLMSASVCRLRPSQIFEWGTHVGKSARVFYESAKQFRIPLQIHSIDLPDDIDHIEHPKNFRGMLVRELPDVHLHQGDGLTTALSVWRSNGRQPAPLFFIDGDHTYESVYRELSAVALEVADANILLHDAFYQSSESGYNIGPFKAIEEVLRKFPDRYKKIDSGLGLPGMTLLYQLRS